MSLVSSSELACWWRRFPVKPLLFPRTSPSDMDCEFIWYLEDVLLSFRDSTGIQGDVVSGPEQHCHDHGQLATPSPAVPKPSCWWHSRHARLNLNTESRGLMPTGRMSEVPSEISLLLAQLVTTLREFVFSPNKRQIVACFAGETVGPGAGRWHPRSWVRCWGLLRCNSVGGGERELQGVCVWMGTGTKFWENVQT